MTLEERMRLSYYKELTMFNEKHGIIFVQHTETKGIYLKKTLDNYQLDIFLRLKANPVPNMPRIYEAIEDNGQLIVIESFINGKTLLQQMIDQGPFPISKVKNIGIQLCSILEHLHSMGIVHRDIKPENIIYDDNGTVTLLDLDAAKVYKRGESQDTKFIGTREYAAPEQYGFGASSPITDIYAMGVLLNVMATGEYPRIKLTSDPDLRDIVRLCTQLDQKNRFLSVKALKAALSEDAPAMHANVEKRSDAAIAKAVIQKQTVDPYAQIARTVPHAPQQGQSFVDNMMRAGDGWHRFLLPGFRSGTLWHMIVAAVWYLASLSIIVRAITSPDPSLTKLENIFHICHYVIITFGLPAVFCNFLGILDAFKITKIRNVILRLFVCYFFFMLIFLFLGFIEFAIFGKMVIPESVSSITNSVGS